MSTIAEQLTSLANTKTAIKDAIVAKGVSIADTDPFSAYPAKIGQIESGGGGGAPATKFGVSIDDIFGNVDANGVYTPSAEKFVLNLSGVKEVVDSAMRSLFTDFTSNGHAKGLVGVVANDLIKVGNSSFFYFSSKNTDLEYVYMDALEQVTNTIAFSNAFSFAKRASFKKLKRITGDSAFAAAFSNSVLVLDEVFPSLEYVSGKTVLSSIIKSSSSNPASITLSKIKTLLNQSSSDYQAVFASLYADIYLPSCTEVAKYLCSKSYKCRLHFAAAHQALIEACDGYSYKFGAEEIYFDLMLSITVNGVVYAREYTIGGYTSWKDTDGDIVYTDATAEPAVGTAVYSDQGTTQVGTVEGVA